MKRLGPLGCWFGFLLVLGFKTPVFRVPAFRAAGPDSLLLRFQNYAGSRPLRLSEETYVNSFGEPFSIQQFKYYISDIRVADDGREEKVWSDPHLVDAGDSASLVLRVPSPLSHIQSIRFTVGVDSVANVSGVQTGDLDPMLGMFWTWNTGYIYARLEGKSDSAHSPAHRFTWDIGGYKASVNAVRVITLKVPEQPTISITADLLKWFDGKRPIRIAESPICHQPGPLAMRIADNYSTMFSVGP